jgi:hypothetical protein
MTFCTDTIRPPPDSSVKTMGPRGVTYAHEKPKGKKRYGDICAHVPPVDKSIEEDAKEEQEDQANQPLGNNLPTGPPQRSTRLPSRNSKDKEEEYEDTKESNDKYDQPKDIKHGDRQVLLVEDPE